MSALYKNKESFETDRSANEKAKVSTTAPPVSIVIVSHRKNSFWKTNWRHVFYGSSFLDKILKIYHHHRPFARLATWCLVTGLTTPSYSAFLKIEEEEARKFMDAHDHPLYLALCRSSAREAL